MFNSFLVRDKETQEETFLSFEQLTDIVESKKGGLTFKTQYQPCAPKDIVIETRKDHPTIM